MKHRFFRWAGTLYLSVTLALSLAVSAWGASFTVEIDDITVREEASATISPRVTGLPEGTEVSYTWTIPENGRNIAQSTGGGVVKGLKAGTTSMKVEARADGYDVASDTCVITVEAAATEETTVQLNKHELTLEPGETKILTATVLPSSLPNRRVSWESSAPDVISVTQGRVTAKAETGSAVITVRSAADPTKTDTCTVTIVEPETKIRITPIKAVSVGETVQLNVEITPKTASQAVTWTASAAGIAEVDGRNRVRGLLPGETVLTATTADGKASATVTVTVSGIRLLDGNGNMVDGQTINLHIGESRNLTVRAFGAASVSTTQWQSTAATIARVTGSGSTGYISGVEEGNSTIRVSMGSYATSCEVKVTINTASTITGNVKAGNPFPFSQIRGQLSQVCREMTKTDVSAGAALSYITNLNVSPNEGVLYYRHVSSADTGAGVSATERYYYSDTSSGHRMLQDLTFVPKSDFSGTAVITYTGWGPNQESFSGSIHLTVEGLDDVTYTVGKDSPLEFQINDFNLICRARTGRDLNYVTFELPPESQGTLYYNYNSQAVYSEKVSAGTQYTRSRTPSLGEITFLPAQGFGGTVRIPYRGVDTNGSSYTGKVTIYVENKEGTEAGDVRYVADIGERVEFEAAHFNAACREITDQALDYVRFTLPDASEGRLYYDYRSSRNPGSAVSAGSYYYRSGTPSLSSVSFVPASSAPAQVVIPFTGYSVSGTSFTGKVYIDTGESEAQAVRYSVRGGRAVNFQPADFNDVCRQTTGYNLSHVRFQLPASGQGVLYDQYNSNRNTYTDRVSSTTNYYRTSGGRQIEDVSFRANEDYSGTVRIGYTGYSENGDRYTGIVEIEVNSEALAAVSYSGISGTPVRLAASSLRSACAAALADELSYLQFTSLPASSTGRLYAEYTSSGSGSPVSTGTRYYNSGTPGIDQLSFVPQSGYQGTAYISYTAVSASGEQVDGQISIAITAASTGTLPTTGSSYFSDMANHRWAISAVDYLYQHSVVSGMGSGQYGPGLNIRRGDFVVMLCKAFGITGGSGTGFADVPSSAYYAQAVSAARSRGIVSGDGTNFRPDSQLTRQDAMVMIQNAMVSVGWSLGDGTSVDLSRFSDSGSISGYARNAVGNLVRLGAVSGSGGRLRPQDPITRAEMAVILHFVMTL